MSAEIYVATTSGTVRLDDGTICQLQAGVTRVRAGHPLLSQGRDSMFRPIDVHYDVARDEEVPVMPEVEQATDRPGEARRGPGRPRKNPE